MAGDNPRKSDSLSDVYSVQELLQEARTEPQEFDANLVAEIIDFLATANSPETKRYVLRLLSELANSRPELVESFVNRIATELDSDDRFVRLLAAETLSKIALDHPKEIEPYLDSLVLTVGEYGSHPWIRISILKSLGKLAMINPELIQQRSKDLQKLFELANEDIQMEVADVLARAAIQMDKETELEALVTNEKESIRNGTAIAFSELAQESPSQLVSYLSQITTLAKDERALVQRNALLSLDAIAREHPEAISELLDLLLETVREDVYFVQKRALAVIRTVGSKSVVPDLREIKEEVNSSTERDIHETIQQIETSGDTS